MPKWRVLVVVVFVVVIAGTAAAAPKWQLPRFDFALDWLFGGSRTSVDSPTTALKGTVPSAKFNAPTKRTIAVSDDGTLLCGELYKACIYNGFSNSEPCQKYRACYYKATQVAPAP
jgi:hypothetical protein